MHLDHSIRASTERNSPHGKASDAAALAMHTLECLLTQASLCLCVVSPDYSLTLGARSPRLPAITLQFSRTSDANEIVLKPSLYKLAKLFFEEKVDFYGSIECLVEIIFIININSDQKIGFAERLLLTFDNQLKRWLPALARRFESNFHYNLSADAYRLFLDKNMQYTCGKSKGANEPLDVLQTNKFALINSLFEKFTVNSARKHLDIGCGWGGLISYLPQNFGFHSKGLTNSQSQFDTIIKEQGPDKAIFANFLDADSSHTHKFDLITVVGMSEHLVPTNKNRLLSFVHRNLEDNGFVYFQSIAKPNVWIGGDAYRLVQRYVFPGHVLDTRAEMEERFASNGFNVVFAEDGGLDYGRTLRFWADNVNNHFDEIVALIGKKDARIFLMYLYYGSKLFSVGRGSLMRFGLKKKSA